MNNYSWKKHYAIKSEFDKNNTWIPEKSGIYLWTRYDKDINKTYFYVGQAHNLRSRRFDYYKLQTGLSYPTRHFEASLKAHKDWVYQIIEECAENQLNEREQYYINYYMRKDNYITRNDSLTGSDITKTNANRIMKIKKEFYKNVGAMLKRLDVNMNGRIVIEIVKNKDGTNNKVSEDKFTMLKKLLKEIQENEI